MNIAKTAIDITFSPRIPSGMVNIYSASIEEVGPFLPVWMRSFYVDYDAEAESILPISIDYSHQKATLFFTSHWLALSIDARRRILFDKIGHLILSPYDSIVRSMFESLKNNGILSEEFISLFEKQIEHGETSSVSELSHLIYNMSQAKEQANA